MSDRSQPWKLLPDRLALANMDPVMDEPLKSNLGKAISVKDGATGNRPGSQIPRDVLFCCMRLVDIGPPQIFGRGAFKKQATKRDNPGTEPII